MVTLNAQTSENEAGGNGTVSGGGVLTISNTGDFTGTVTTITDVSDWWKIAAGSSGSVPISFSESGVGATLSLREFTSSSYTDNGGEGTSVQSWSNGDSKSYTLIASKYYALKTASALLSGGYTITVTGPLPVELTFFVAAVVGAQIVLQWETATEVNNFGFEIERTVISKQSSVISWSKTGFVEGSGTSNSAKEYSFTDKNLNAGTYSYRLKQIDRDGQFTYSQEVEIIIGNAPSIFELKQNFPNPFNPASVISYQLPFTGHVSLIVYDAIGNEVVILVNEVKEAGYHSATFNASNLSTGVYFVRLQSDDAMQMKKMMLLK
jgi:hypothetical protein